VPFRSAHNVPYPYTSPLKTDLSVYDSLAMVEPLPTFEQVLELMRSPKAPIACRVVELDGRTARRTAAVLFDGLQGWYIDDGARVEVRSSDESVLFDSEGNLQRVGPGVGGVHSNGWVKTPIEPRRTSLERATGRVIRRDPLDERPTLGFVSAASRTNGHPSPSDVVVPALPHHLDPRTTFLMRTPRLTGTWDCSLT
jgi:hypothetical protein